MLRIHLKKVSCTGELQRDFSPPRYVPPQRWLHNIEHGSVVMLYHPCAHHTLVDELRAIVKGCIRKRVITPYSGVTEQRVRGLNHVIHFL